MLKKFTIITFLFLNLTAVAASALKTKQYFELGSKEKLVIEGISAVQTTVKRQAYPSLARNNSLSFCEFTPQGASMIREGKKFILRLDAGAEEGRTVIVGLNTKVTIIDCHGKKHKIPVAKAAFCEEPKLVSRVTVSGLKATRDRDFAKPFGLVPSDDEDVI